MCMKLFFCSELRALKKPSFDDGKFNKCFKMSG